MKIVILDGYSVHAKDLNWDLLRPLGELTVYDRTPADQVIARMQGAEIVLTNKCRITREVLEACPALRYLGELATGYNNIDIAAAKERGVVVTNIPGYSTVSVVQHVFALLLYTMSHVAELNQSVHAGDWVNCPDFTYQITPLQELYGRTLGIIGFGQIGQRVARAALAFGMEVVYTCPHRKPELEEEHIRYLPLEELLRVADVVSLHCPQNADTTGLLNAARIATMKRGAIVINTARGGVVVAQDVADALQSGQLGWYLADVMEQEPPRADEPLLTAPHCVLTPHVAWAPREARLRLMAIAYENLKGFLEGNAPHRVA